MIHLINSSMTKKAIDFTATPESKETDGRNFSKKLHDKKDIPNLHLNRSINLTKSPGEDKNINKKKESNSKKQSPMKSSIHGRLENSQSPDKTISQSKIPSTLRSQFDENSR